jgi:alanine racemase
MMLDKEYRVLNEIIVSRDSLVHNYAYFQGKNTNCYIAPVLKSNAYGHGLIQIGQFVDHTIKPPLICVDSLFEAYSLYSEGIKTPILIMGYTDPENYDIWKKLPFIFAVTDLDSARALAKYQPNAHIHIKIDTGMHRLGIQLNDLTTFIEGLKQIKNLSVEGIFSHLATADEPLKQTSTKRQIELFKDMVTQFENAGYNFQWKHIASTAGAEFITDSYFNLIRLGLGFYGYSPFGPHTKEGRVQRTNLQPALTLTSHIATIKEIEPGDKVGYGGTYQAKQKERIAILPLGYNEGLSRSLSNKGIVTIKNSPCPIIGRISMNMAAVKLTRSVQAKAGDSVTIISPDIRSPNSIYQFAALQNTIPYEVLTSLHASIRRRVQ